MNNNRKAAKIAGVLFILATVTSIIGFLLYNPILNDPDYLIKGNTIKLSNIILIVRIKPLQLTA